MGFLRHHEHGIGCRPCETSSKKNGDGKYDISIRQFHHILLLKRAEAGIQLWDPKLTVLSLQSKDHPHDEQTRALRRAWRPDTGHGATPQALQPLDCRSNYPDKDRIISLHPQETARSADRGKNLPDHGLR